ncbi:hypothetical protein TI39_contig475g00013 [Zymoseptoria brevis]|uniref:Zn(2)-C6 fungal-type domain-containing protein n=1 Tax=Zymoseptoria brevis TaxID=1047168 RepID=A0A0F4GK75_9PEZI|nr:hypothetical protein TI39_contig475g00013 [Zymoseptoria brevis]
MSSFKASEIPSHRSCASCRSHKVRCIPDENNPASCQRCVRARRECVFTPVQRRKQRVRTDTRVAELEKEMRAMRAALKQKEEEATKPASPPNLAATTATTAKPPNLWYKDSLPHASSLGQDTTRIQAQSIPASAPVSAVQRQLMPSWSKIPEAQGVDDTQDVVDKGIVSMATARLLFECYRTHLSPRYPIVSIHPDMTAERLREKAPTLFLAVIAAAAYREDSELSTTLDKELLQQYATRNIVQSEKSLDLLQALLISATWYNPPTKYGHLKYYEYMHMAAAMAMEIGIGSRSSIRRIRKIRPDISPRAPSDQNPHASPRQMSASWDVASFENKRTLLACHISCTTICFTMRRPMILRTTNYIRECVDLLDKYPELPTDPLLVAWARLSILCEAISTALGYEDGGIESITDVRTQIMVKGFARELSNWRTNVPELPRGSEALFMMYYNIRLCLFELVLHIEHSPDDFRAPYQMGLVQLFDSQHVDDIPTQVLAEGIAECISSAHAAIDIFVSMDDDSFRSLTVFDYVRITGSLFVLAKLCLSAVQPHGRIGSALDRTILKVEHYMDRTMSRVRGVLDKHRTRSPVLVLALLSMLQQWCIDPLGMSRKLKIEMEEMASSAKAETMDTDEEYERLAVIKLEGPRVEEMMSSPEDSEPQQTEPQADQQHKPDHVAPISANVNIPQANFPQFVGSQMNQSHPQNTANDYNIPLTTNTNENIYVHSMDSMDSMNLGIDSLQFMGDMDAFNGGLTGLEQWDDFPADLTGMDDLNWAMGSMNSNQQGGPF